MEPAILKQIFAVTAYTIQCSSTVS